MDNKTINDTTKVLSISLEPMSKKVITQKPKKQRIITQTDKWSNISDNLLEEEQKGLEKLLDMGEEEGVSKIIAQHIRAKICGYAAQDRLKKLFSVNEFVNFQDVLELFKISELKCYYCKGKTMTLYEYVREPKQWTLERLNNYLGHNRDNVVLACLQCNLRRRTMASERYVKTKEMAIVIKKH